MSRIVPLHTVLDDASHLIATLEQFRTQLPFADEELSYFHALRHKLVEHQSTSEKTLTEWRRALAWRWDCEVAGQRLFLQIRRDLIDCFGANAPQLQLVAPSQTNSARTAAELLDDLRRLYASLTVMQPRPPFAGQRLSELAVACKNLSEALSQTSFWENERRSAILDQRLTFQAYQRAYDQTRQRLDDYLRNEHVSESLV